MQKDPVRRPQSTQGRMKTAGYPVLVASTCGPEGAEVGNVISHQEFIEGKYQDVIRKVFGPEVLAEMLVSCEKILAERASA